MCDIRPRSIGRLEGAKADMHANLDCVKDGTTNALRGHKEASHVRVDQRNTSPVTAWRYAADCDFHGRSPARAGPHRRRPPAVRDRGAPRGSGHDGVCRASATAAPTATTSPGSGANGARG